MSCKPIKINIYEKDSQRLQKTLSKMRKLKHHKLNLNESKTDPSTRPKPPKS